MSHTFIRTLDHSRGPSINPAYVSKCFKTQMEGEFGARLVEAGTPGRDVNCFETNSGKEVPWNR